MTTSSTTTAFESGPSSATPPGARLIPRRKPKIQSERCTPAASRPARSAVAMRSATENLALACQIIDELVAASVEPTTTSCGPTVIPALQAIGFRDPRAMAAAVARDALNRTVDASADLPHALADIVLEDVVRTDRLIDAALRQ